MYLVTYVINESGYEFLNKINKETFNKSFFEGEIFGENIDLEISKELTVFSVGIKYGWFILEEEPQTRIKEFEEKLMKVLNIEKYDYILRVDESLVEKYWSKYVNNEYWFKEENAFDRFSKWITTQESLHWKKIYLTPAGASLP
ncbi:hypothetical protein [Flavivirga algicola]|uniref:Uncharacterized protein n=1 Tax=Flavivirga algicola TaxID=2729136 RepID=A0ABX1RSB6_9FLAO|nr:hypothetical protein [Flavivirga algicola]NMH85958.1 hypothetical protein [Flavivirga algicola]